MVKFHMIVRIGYVVIFNKICSWRARKVSLVALRVQFCVFRVGLWSDWSRIMLRSVAYWKCHFSCFQYIYLKFGSAMLRDRRNIRWGWRLMPVVPRIINDFLYVMRINHNTPFAWQAQYFVCLAGVYLWCGLIVTLHSAWQAQYLVRLEVDACSSAHCKWCFICDVKFHFAWQMQYLVGLEGDTCCFAH